MRFFHPCRRFEGVQPHPPLFLLQDRFYSLFADLVRIDNDTAVSSTITTAASPSTVVSPTFPSPPVSTTSLSCPPPPDIDIDLSLTSDDDDDYTPELETASGENRPSFASTFKSTFAPIPPASPLRPFLSTSTASIRFSMQSMLRPDNRTEEEKRESIRRRTELNKSTQRDTYRETQEQKRLNPPADVVVRINSFDTIYDWMSKARGKNTATEEFKAIGGFVEGVKSNEVTKDQMRAWMRAEGYFPPDTTGADIRLTDYKAKQAAKEANPPADVVAQIRSFMTTKAWTTGGTERGNAATKEFRAVGGYIEGVAAPQVTRPQMKHWLAKKGYLVFNG